MHRKPFVMFAFSAALAILTFCHSDSFAQGWTLNGTTTSTTNNVVIGSSNPVNMLNISNGGYASVLLGNDDNGGFVITKESSDNSFNIWRGPYEAASLRFRIQNTGEIYVANNLGLGTALPTYKLDLVAARPNDGMRMMYNNTGWITLQPNTLGQSSYNLITQNGDAGLVYGNYNTSNPATGFGFVITPWLNTQSGLRLDKDGNVGICTGNTYGYQLAVNGNAVFNKVVVKQYSNWPDYVFDSAYQLRPLEKVGEYVKANHHLPEIPSADSVAKNGIDIGANQAALLKKVEELTLYMIQLNETVKQQQEKISQLEGRLNRKAK